MGQVATFLRPWVERFARLGFAAKTLVYFVVSWLTGAAALGVGEAAGPLDAISEIAGRPFGRALLFLLAPGLLGYCLWRLSQAATDPRGVGRGIVGLAIRIGDGVTGLVYGVLFVVVAEEVVSPGGTAFEGPRNFLLLAQTTLAGRIALGTVGLVLMVTGVVQLRNALVGAFWETFDRPRMRRAVARFVNVMGRVAFTAWGVIFGLFGYFLVKSAITGATTYEVGVGSTLRQVERESHEWDPWPLLLLAVGLMGFAIFAGLETRWRRIDAA